MDDLNKNHTPPAIVSHVAAVADPAVLPVMDFSEFLRTPPVPRPSQSEQDERNRRQERLMRQQEREEQRRRERGLG